MLVVAAFASIVASTFQATYVDGVLDTAASATNASVAMISLLFIVMAVLFGFFVYRRGASLAVATIAGCVGIVICLLIGLNWHPIYPVSYTPLDVYKRQVYNFLPFMILPIYSVIVKLDHRLIEAARDLGADSVTVFRRVTLPLRCV